MNIGGVAKLCPATQDSYTAPATLSANEGHINTRSTRFGHGASGDSASLKWPNLGGSCVNQLLCAGSLRIENPLALICQFTVISINCVWAVSR